MITDQEITKHFMEVSKLLNEHLKCFALDMVLVYNNSPIYGKLQPKKGFSVVMELDMPNYKNLMFDMAKQLIDAPEECRVYFTRGCFDGRSSFDTTRHFLSIDVDRDIPRQNLIAKIIRSIGLDVDLNQRGQYYDKNDQIRIVPQKLRTYMTKVGFYSYRRHDIVNDYLNS